MFQEKDIHFWNKEKFGEGYKNDLALVVAPVPVQIASPNKAATFTPLAEHREYKAGEPVSTIGYPTDSTSPELKEPIVPGLSLIHIWVRMGSQIQMVLIAIGFQPSLRLTREL